MNKEDHVQLYIRLVAVLNEKWPSREMADWQHNAHTALKIANVAADVYSSSKPGKNANEGAHY